MVLTVMKNFIPGTVVAFFSIHCLLLSLSLVNGSTLIKVERVCGNMVTDMVTTLT